jgi:hypothetical protein
VHIPLFPLPLSLLYLPLLSLSFLSLLSLPLQGNYIQSNQSGLGVIIHWHYFNSQLWISEIRTYVDWMATSEQNGRTNFISASRRKIPAWRMWNMMDLSESTDLALYVCQMDTHSPHFLCFSCIFLYSSSHSLCRYVGGTVSWGTYTIV